MINLEESLVEINERVINMIRKTSRAIEVLALTLDLEKFDKYLYGESKLIEEECDELEISIEEEATIALVRYQPAAGDLRYILGIMKIIMDLERISDLSTGIMRLVKSVYKCENKCELVEPLRRMSKKIKTIFEIFERSFIEKNMTNSYLVLGLDDEIDEIRDEVYNETGKKIEGNIELINAGLKVVAIAQKFERMADLIQNLAEINIYISKGDILKHKGIEE